MLAPILSDGRRARAGMVSGAGRSFHTDLRTVFVPYPLPPGTPCHDPLQVLTCGVALQGAPSKEAVVSLPVDRLTAPERRALLIVEGAASRAWVTQRWPGLAQRLEDLLPGVGVGDPDAGRESLLEQALQLADGDTRAIPPLLGDLPRAAGGRSDGWSSALGASWRMPWSQTRTYRRHRRQLIMSIPIGGSGAHQASAPGPQTGQEDDVRSSPSRRVGIPYDEWDMSSASYRKAFVNVVEIASRGIASRAGQADPDVAAWFRRSPDYDWARRRPDGVALDVEAYVDEYRAALAGEETRGHVYADLRPARRDVATALLLDASSSLNAAGGRSMRLQLECADALTEALSQAGEPYAAFAFTGSTRHHVAVEVLRDFADEGFVRPTETALQPDGYTRLGAALRHVTARLLDVAAERRILIALGDGLPSDEGYEGPYAIHDVAKAIEEATAEGVIAFYVGVGRVRRDRLHDALGDYSMERVNDVAELPTVLATIYERLRRQ